MKRLMVGAVFFAALCHGVRAEEEKFTKSVPADEMVASGLASLTPAQLARVDALVEAYKSGALAAARRATDEALAAKREAEALAARREAEANTARLEAARATEAAKPVATTTPSDGVVAKAKRLLKPTPHEAEPAVESTIPGKFSGWEPRQIFVLANGQQVQIANRESYYSPVIENPRVQVVPAAMAGYWLRFPDLGTQVRVNVLSDK